MKRKRTRTFPTYQITNTSIYIYLFNIWCMICLQFVDSSKWADWNVVIKTGSENNCWFWRLKTDSYLKDIYCRRLTRGRRGEGSPLPFFEKRKKVPWFGEKNDVVVIIYGQKFSFKMKFLRVSRRKSQIFFPCGAFLSRFVAECLSRCPYSKKTPLP